MSLTGAGFEAQLQGVSLYVAFNCSKTLIFIYTQVLLSMFVSVKWVGKSFRSHASMFSVGFNIQEDFHKQSGRMRTLDSNGTMYLPELIKY